MILAQNSDPKQQTPCELLNKVVLSYFLAMQDTHLFLSSPQCRNCILCAVCVCSIVNYSDPRDRMVAVVKWYLSAFHAGRKVICFTFFRNLKTFVSVSEGVGQA